MSSLAEYEEIGEKWRKSLVAEDWVLDAEAVISYTGTIFSIYATVHGVGMENAQRAKNACGDLLHILADGKLTFIRVNPESRAEKNFMCDRVDVIGYVRFVFKDEPGEWIDDSDRPLPGVGEYCAAS